jgi:hypothetical protein
LVTANSANSDSTGSRCVVYALQFISGSWAGNGPPTRSRAASSSSSSGPICLRTGASSVSNDGIGCGSKRVSGIAQRSISPSNTDSAPKKKATIRT